MIGAHCMCARAQQAFEPGGSAGVGMALGVEEGKIVVLQVLADSPAAASHQIREHDRILAVGEGEEPAVSLENKTLEECVAMIRGEAGTQVRLTVLPEKAPAGASREVMLTRDELRAPLGLALDASLLKKGTPAPELRYLRLDNGAEATLAGSLRGKVVVLEFWATWCAPCQQTMTNLQKLAEKHADQKDKLVFLGISIDSGSSSVNVGEVRKKVTEHAQKKQWTHTINGWSPIEGRKNWHVGMVPLTYVVGADGTILEADPDSQTLERTIASALAR